MSLFLNISLILLMIAEVNTSSLMRPCCQYSPYPAISLFSAQITISGLSNPTSASNKCYNDAHVDHVKPLLTQALH